MISRDIGWYNTPTYDSTLKIQVDDYKEETIELTVKNLPDDTITPYTRVFICLGILKTNTTVPEKRLQDFSALGFMDTLLVNSVTPLVWIKSLIPLLASQHECKVVIFSARVGSITDNKLGGWYSYRGSKAALNMLLKTAAIELSRIAKNIKLISFHPGTTDTKLSKPFLRNVSPQKIFSADFVAQRLQTILKTTHIDGELSFIDWDNKPIDW